LKIIEGFKLAEEVLSRRASTEFYDNSLEPQVKQIIDEVRGGGDAALFGCTLKYDRVKLSALEVDSQQLKAARGQLDKGLVSALELAAERIASFHSRQKDMLASSPAGQLVRPLERVGVYAPGGTAAYPSTVLMTAIPARIAGVKEVILTTPPRPDGTVAPATLAAADIAGVDRVFSIGGAQAIAALAFGTESVPAVDKICGPGNIFVVLAKKLVYGVVDIDGLPGPSEVVIIADESARPVYCAADILAQAEHDPLASAILITTSRRLADDVNKEVEEQLKDLPRREIAAESLRKQGVIAVVSDIDQAVELANLYAPEHLCLMAKDADALVKRLTSAGCIVTGEGATVVLGDYVFGPSHVLPTGATARFGSPLNVLDFVKFTSLIKADRVALEQLGSAAAAIARAEGLQAHARAVEKRLKAG
jgi:histidinol dehydrogenase